MAGESAVIDRISPITALEPSLTNHYSPTADFRYSCPPMHDRGFVREHPEIIKKMARDRGITLDFAPFRELDGETVHNAFPDRGFRVPVSWRG
jgi:hypothetical protein